MFGSDFTTLIISNWKMNDIMKIVKSLEESAFLIKDVNETKKMKQKNKKKNCYHAFSVLVYMEIF